MPHYEASLTSDVLVDPFKRIRETCSFDHCRVRCFVHRIRRTKSGPALDGVSSGAQTELQAWCAAQSSASALITDKP